MKNKKVLKILLFFCFVIAFFSIKVEAKSYYIDNMDIQATIRNDGCVDVEQSLEYVFKGEYNGVFIKIPIVLYDKENPEINDDTYSATDLILSKISLIQDGEEIPFSQDQYAINGNTGVYSINTNSGVYEIKAYSPSKNEKKKFKFNYTLNNLCVCHNDIGELYYNFIGGAWECKINNLNIDVYIPNNVDTLKIWGHGPDNGISKIIDNTHANFKVSDIRAGKYVATRVAFDKSVLKECVKNSNIDQLDNILNNEYVVSKISDKKKNFSKVIFIIALVLFLYWIFLLEKYEKDEKFLSPFDEDALLNKYSPIVAGCLQGNREVLSRDIIAEILYLIDKKYIELIIKPNPKKKNGYNYFIKRVPEKEEELNAIEKMIYFWIFDNISEKIEMDLVGRLKRLPEEVDATTKFNKLNDMVQSNLNHKGGNIHGVDKKVLVANNLIMLGSVILVIFNILQRGLFSGVGVGLKMSNAYGYIYWGIIILLFALLFLPIVFYYPIRLLLLLKTKINKLVSNYSNPKLLSRACFITIIYLAIIALSLKFLSRANRYLIVDEILLWVTTLIMFTDNLMMKHSLRIIKDYSNLNQIKDRLEKGSLLKDRDIEYVNLWDFYIAYAVSFGVSSKVISKIKDIADDSLLKVVLDAQFYNTFLSNDYGYFYKLAGENALFIKEYSAYKDSLIDDFLDMASDLGGSDSYRRRRRRFLWRRRLFWRWRRPEAGGGAF